MLLKYFFSFLEGQSIAVHTPSKRITACEILRMGKYVVLGLENEPNLVILELKNSNVSNNIVHQLSANKESSFYGDAELNGKITDFIAGCEVRNS